MIVKWVDRWLGEGGLGSLLFPPTCVLCGAPGQRSGGGLDLCPGCARDMPHHRYGCVQCAAPLPSVLAKTGMRCAVCERRSPPFDLSLSAFRYEGVVPMLVTGAKFRGRLDQVRLLGRCLAERVREAGPPRPDLVVPVPLHPQRQRQRGYNQALEIARVVGRELGLAIAPDLLVRTRSTPPQAGLDQRARLSNLSGAFAIKGAPQGRAVALVDDVMTTGSTVSELSHVLRQAGVAHIQVWAVARTT